MGDREVHVLTHTVLPMVVMAATASEDESDSSLYETARGMIEDTVYDATADQVEVLREDIDVSHDDYVQELEKTAEEAEDHDRVYVPDNSYGEHVADYLRDNTDVSISQYDAPEIEEEQGIDAPGPYEVGRFVKKQELEDKKQWEEAGLIKKAGMTTVRWMEDAGDYAAPNDYRSENMPYADMDFVKVNLQEQYEPEEHDNEQYKELIDNIKEDSDAGESALIVTRSPAVSDVTNVLDEAGINYTERDALDD